MANTGQAAVQSVDAISTFRVATLTFASEIQSALAEAEADITRLPQWLKLDRVPHWTGQIKHRERDVQAAKRDLARKQMMTSPEPQSCIDEKKKLQRATASLEEATGKLAATRRWILLWDEQSSQLRAALAQLRELSERDLLVLAAKLAKQVQLLEAYLAVSTGSGEGAGGTAQSAGRLRDYGSADRLSAYGHLRKLAVPASVRVACEMSDESSLSKEQGPPIRIDDLEQLERLALEGIAPRSADRVLLEPGALASPVLCMIRTEPIAAAGGTSKTTGDSGWYLAGPGAAGLQPQAPVAVSIMTILEQRPDLTVPLLMPAGIMLGASDGQVVSVADQSNQELWS